MKKRIGIIAVVLVGLLAFSVTACGKEEDSASAQAESLSSVSDDSEETKPGLLSQIQEEQVAVAYDDIITYLTAGYEENWKSRRPKAEKLLSNIYKSGDPSMGYYIGDINFDGINDLVIGKNSRDGEKTVIYDLYSPDQNGNVQHVFSGRKQDRAAITSQGIVVERGKDEQGHSFEKVYQLFAGQMKGTDEDVTDAEYLQFELKLFAASASDGKSE